MASRADVSARCLSVTGQHGASEENVGVTSCAHLDTIEVLDVPDEVPGCEECLAHGRPMGAPADVPALRAHRLLRQLAQPARDRPPRGDRPPDHPLRRARREVELVLRGRADVPAPVVMSPVRPTVTVVGRRLETEDHRLRDFLTRTAQPYDWLEAGTPDADAALAARGLSDAELPVLIDRRRGARAARPSRRWPTLGPSTRSRRRRTTTWRSSAPGPPGWPPRSTPRPTGSRRSSSSATSRAARPRTPR